MQTNRKGFHDIEVEFEKIMMDSGMVDEMFYLQDLRNRKLYLNEGIDQCSVAEIVEHILRYNSDDKGLDPTERKPILLYVVSEGGEVDSGFELIDTIQCSKTPHLHHKSRLPVFYGVPDWIGRSQAVRYEERQVPDARWFKLCI